MIDLSKIKEYKECNRIEAKKAVGGFPRSLWETYSSFANTQGGIILLGVEERADKSLKICGVNDAGKIVAEFWNAVNDRNKVSVNLLRDSDVVVYNDGEREVVEIRIPKADRHDKPVYINGNIMKGSYRRNGDGDYHCSENEIKFMLKDQSDISQDMIVLSNMDFSVFDFETISRYRLSLRNRKINHPWNEVDNINFLHKIGAAARSDLDGELHPTTAGLLMFGYEYEIVREFPNYLLDYQEKLESSLRWTDRIVSNLGDWSGNIYDFYLKVSRKLVEDLKVSFNLVGMQRVDSSMLEEPIREALANALIHSNYYDRQGLVVTKYADKITIENPGIFRVNIEDAICGGISDPRNTQIMKMFALIGVCERAGSGLYSIFDVWERAELDIPIVHEQFNPDRIILSLNTTRKNNLNINEGVNEGINEGINETETLIYAEIKNNSMVTASVLAVKINRNKSNVEKAIRSLREKGYIKRIGSNRNGYWQILK